MSSGREQDRGETTNVRRSAAGWTLLGAATLVLALAPLSGRIVAEDPSAENEADSSGCPAMQNMSAEAYGAYGEDMLPPGHPPVDSMQLPPGHPPIARGLPPGHPPVSTTPRLPAGHPPVDGSEQGGQFAPGFLMTL